MSNGWRPQLNVFQTHFLLVAFSEPDESQSCVFDSYLHTHFCWSENRSSNVLKNEDSRFADDAPQQTTSFFFFAPFCFRKTSVLMQLYQTAH